MDMPGWVEMAVALAAVLTAAVVRGYSGFGFAMVGVTGMSLVMPPSLVVPAVLLLEVAASLQLLPRVWKDVSWVSLRCLFIGSVAAVPLGVYLLAHVPRRRHARRPSRSWCWRRPCCSPAASR